MATKPASTKPHTRELGSMYVRISEDGGFLLAEIMHPQGLKKPFPVAAILAALAQDEAIKERFVKLALEAVGTLLAGEKVAEVIQWETGPLPAGLRRSSASSAS